jgi:hypothetical protein
MSKLTTIKAGRNTAQKASGDETARSALFEAIDAAKLRAPRGRGRLLLRLCAQCRAPFCARWNEWRWAEFCCLGCSNTHHNQTPKMRTAASERCLRRGAPNLKHNESFMGRTKEYDAWRAMKRRCSPNNQESAPYYSQRGITVCARWADSYEAFLADVGRKPSPQHSLDRINNDGNYEPGNVRWATWSQQMLNRRCASRS